MERGRTSPRAGIAMAAVLGTLVLGPAGCSRARPDAPQGAAQYDGIEGPLHLSLDAMTALPVGTVLIGGSYRTDTGPVHSALLISRDGGKTWMDAPFRFPLDTIGRLESVGSDMVWALVTFNAEGARNPEYLLVSRDAGASFDTIPWTWNPPGPLLEVTDLRFLDRMHGLAWIQSSIGHGQMLQTSDAGRSWHRVWDTTDAPDLDWPLKYPSEPEPLHASVLVPQPGYATPAQGLLRLVEPDGSEEPFTIERIVYWQGRAPRDAVWEKWSEIPRAYVVVKGSLEPRKGS